MRISHWLPAKFICVTIGDADWNIMTAHCTDATNKKPSFFPFLTIGHYKWRRRQSLDLQLFRVSYCPQTDVIQKILRQNAWICQGSMVSCVRCIPEPMQTPPWSFLPPCQRSTFDICASCIF